jgi:tRNA threonylcarbamoyl adenosine modification protein YeaZ
LILAFDTSAAHCAAALLSGDAVVAQAFAPMTRGQAEHLMPMVAQVMAEAGADLSELDGIAVGIGPGNFTGIRIAVSAARGLALALGKPAIGVSGLEALAQGAGDVLACLEARRGQLYLQRFGTSPRGPEMVMADGIGADWVLPGLRVVGPVAGVVAAQLGLAAVDAPALAPAMARIAARRLSAPGPRPAPIYLRPADAAPAKDTGLVMLPQ